MRAALRTRLHSRPSALSERARAPAGRRLPCDETTPALPLGSNERTDRLLRAEKEVVDAGGVVVRLSGERRCAAHMGVTVPRAPAGAPSRRIPTAPERVSRPRLLASAGLYTADRGAHTFFLRVPEVKSRPDGLVRLLPTGRAIPSRPAAAEH